MAAIDIGVKFSIEKIGEVVNGFNQLVQGLDLGKGFELDKVAINTQFEQVSRKLQEALNTGELDVKSLNLPGLIRSLEIVARSAASALGTELNDKAIQPFKDELEYIGNEIDKKANELKDITEQRKSLTQEAVKKQTKEQTGFGSKVMYGSETEALAILQKLKEAEGEDPQGSAKRTEYINFYTAYVENLKQAEIARAKLNEQEKLVKTGIAAQKAKEESLLLKIKKESVKVDAQSPQIYKTILMLTEHLRTVHEQLRKTQKESNDEKKKAIELGEKQVKTDQKEVQGLASKAIGAGLYYAALNAVKRVIRESIRVVKELDEAMTSAAIVTEMNRKEAWALLGTYQQLAKQTGLVVSEISGVVVEFLRQGRTMKEALELAEVAAKSAKVAGINANEAVKYLTSAINGFGLAASDAEMIADKFAAISASSASNFEELAIAMSKVAPVAKSAGVGIDFMMGVLAKGLETTREAPENIGTAFKTIFARMREVTDIGKATEDGMSLNRVEKALASISVPLRNVSGQFRNLEDVLIDVGNKWDTLTSIEQAYIATSLAGTRQQPRLLAIFNDFARTKELIELSSESVGALQFQHIDYMEGMEAAMNNLKNSWQGFIMALTDSDIIITIIEAMTLALDELAKGFKFLSTPLGYTLGVVVSLGAALILVTAKTIKNTTAKIANTIATIANNVAEGRSKKFKKEVADMDLKQMIAALKSAAAKNANTVAAKAGTKANLGFAASLNLVAAYIWTTLASFLPFIAAAAILVGIVAMLVFSFNEAAKGAEFFGNEIATLNKRINDIETKENKVKKLTDRFKELQKITNKTSEDIKEMTDITEELGEVELTVGKNQEKRTYNFATIDFTGASVFDEEEYNRFMKDAADEKERLDKIAAKKFTDAIRKGGAEAFKNKEVSNFARKIGYEAGVDYADSLGDGISDETKSKVKKQLADSLKKMDMSVFYKTGYRYKNKIYDTLKEAQEAAAADGFSANLQFSQTTSFDEEGLAEFSQKITSIYANSTQNLQNEIDRIMDPRNRLSSAEQTKQILLATAESYRDQIQEARDTLEGVELTAALAIIGQSNIDGQILDMLINERKIDIDLIYDLQAQGLEIDEIQEYISSFGDFNLKAGGSRMGMSEEDYDRYIRSRGAGVLSSIQQAASGGAENITQGFASFRENLAALGYTPEEIEAEVRKLGEIIKTLSVEQVGAMITTQGQMTKKAMDLASQIAKGDFSNFGEIVAEYGLDGAMAILNGSEAGIRAVIEKNKEETLGEIASSIAEIYALEGVDSFDELSEAAQEQVRALELMADYYDDIVGYELLREFRMKKITGYMKQMNDLLKLQESLMNLGMAGDSPFIQTLNGMVESLDNLARVRINKQLEDDLARLEQFGTFDDEGNFIVNPDINIAQAEAAIEAAMGTLTTYVQMQTEAFNRQKKAIEDASKAEIDAAKKAFDERWRAIEYTDKLAEAENKIFEARRRIAAMAISGIGRGQMTQALEDLRKIEQERRKMIEQQALEETQKELEAQRDEAIVAAQVQMTAAIEGYTNQLAEIFPELTAALENLIIALDDNTEATEEEINNVTAGRDKSRQFTDMNFIG
jgi:TP901 family phage tail tape measure protein